MAHWFQSPNYRRDDYARPNQRWICGHACDGRVCPFGPDARGHCHTTGECRPLKQGDRWLCTRPESHDGLCAEGPLPDGTCCHQIGPCQPVPSLRARRGRWVGAVAAGTLGLLGWFFASTRREAILSPGPLTSAHAMANAQCRDCHNAGADVGFASSLHVTDQQCLSCHNLGAAPRAAHGFSAGQLARFATAPGAKAGAGRAASVLLAVARRTVPFAAGATDCTDCHREHHGRDASLTRLTDQQCQVCHQATFGSFAQGHPEFTDYPYRRRTRLIFDHASHLQTHFADKSLAALAPTQCNDCHATAAMGGVMLVRGFKESCAACHRGQIEGEGRAGSKGLAFFRVPGLDTDTLAGHQRTVGDWPRDADGRLTPFMRLLLQRDPATAAACNALEDVDLLDLRSATPAQLAAAETFAWGVKSLLADLVTQGQTALVTSLRETMSLDRQLTRNLAAQLPRAGLIAAQQAWFPHLLTEMVDHRAGRKVAAPIPVSLTKPAPTASNPAAATNGDLLAGDDDLSEVPVVAAKPAPKPATQGDELLDESSTGATPVKPSPPATPVETRPLTIAAAENWVSVGGWYGQDSDFTLYYRPTGHADAFLTDWLTVAGELSAQPAAQPLFAQLTAAKAPGLCAKCHSVDQAPGSAVRQVNWLGARPDAAEHPATKFDHAKHFSLLSDHGCQTCHTLNTKSDYQVAFADSRNAAIFQSNFAALPKATCVRCHNTEVSGADCRVCHNYHTGSFANDMPKVAGSLSAPAPASKNEPQKSGSGPPR